MGVSTGQCWAARSTPMMSSFSICTLSFLILVLAVLLLVGGIEPNPGPFNKNYKESDVAWGINEEPVAVLKDKLRRYEQSLELREDYINMREMELEGRERYLKAKEERISRNPWLCVTELLEQAKDKRLALLWAAEGGYLSVMQRLLPGHTKVTTVTDDDKRSMIIRAASAGQLKIVKYLWEQSIAESQDEAGMTAISWAAKGGHLPVVQFLFEKSKLIKIDHFGRSALLHAACKGHWKVVKYFLRKLNDEYHFEDKDKNGMTVLSYAAKEGNYDLVQYLMEKVNGINTYERGNIGLALHQAAQNGHLKVLQYLLQNVTPVCYVDYNNSRRSLPLLLLCFLQHHIYYYRHYVYYDKFMRDVRHALYLAKDEGHLEIVQYLNQVAKSERDPALEYFMQCELLQIYCVIVILLVLWIMYQMNKFCAHSCAAR